MSGVSLIISSYNQPNALALVLAGVRTQVDATGRPPWSEILVADDGSQADTGELVATFDREVEVPVRFLTQPDQGFRKSRALNNAIRAAAGEFVLFLDGDCVPPPGWAERFLAELRRGWDFVTAGYVLMDLPRSQALDPAAIRAGMLAAHCTDEEAAEFRRIHRKEVFYRLIGKAKKPKILGGNWAATRACLDAVNGFDEKFDGFGKEDSDIRNRLRNAGYRGRSCWHTNWVFHCSHDLDPRRNLPEVVRRPPDYTYYASRRNATTCELGLRRPGAASS